jgi:Sulfotransferase family
VSNKIVINDFREPVLTDEQRFFVERAEQNPAELTAESVLSAAVERTGLDDFGPDDFKPRMQLLLDEVGADANATEFNRATLHRRLVGVLANRLLRQDVIMRNPEVHDVRIDRPIIVAGLPRSGTTHLLGLIAADSRLRSMPLWEAVEPFAKQSAPEGAVDPRYARAERTWENLQRLNPLMAPFHPMDPDHIHEDIELQVPDIASYYWEWMFKVPSWRDHYLSTDQTPHYEFARTTLQAMSWQSGDDKRWVLKCPQHFEQLRPLMSVYPDALVVFTHRDPMASLQSIVTEGVYEGRFREKKVDVEWHLDYWTDRVRKLLEAYVRDADVVPASQRLDVDFNELVTDDEAVMRRVYDVAGLAVTEQSEAERAAYVESHPRRKHGEIDNDLGRNFGADVEAIREQFSFYYDKMPLTARPA